MVSCIESTSHASYFSLVISASPAALRQPLHCLSAPISTLLPAGRSASATGRSIYDDDHRGLRYGVIVGKHGHTVISSKMKLKL